MRFGAVVLLLAGVALPAGAARESWTGSYQCGPSSAGSGYSSRITMLIEDGEAHITRESAQIKESMSGRVASDGTLKLEGTGARKEGGTGWLYRFDGRIEANRFEARGAMLSPNMSSRLRECSMSLTKMRSTGSLPAPEAAVKLKPSTETKPVPALVAEALTPTLAESLSAKPRAGAGEPIERELDFAGKSDTATMEGTAFRGAPHRYYLSARRGQTVSAALKSDGARIDLYEPGATLTLLSSGFVVQGSRVGATTDGERVDVDLPADGKYLLLVRANGERAFYTLELKVERQAPSTFETWVKDERVWIAVLIAIALLGLLVLARRKRDRRIFRSG
jgi:hypothetical protein